MGSPTILQAVSKEAGRLNYQVVGKSLFQNISKYFYFKNQQCYFFWLDAFGNAAFLGSPTIMLVCSPEIRT
jgi:hypothetical protein